MMTGSSAGAVITSHIDELEGALQFATLVMDPKLERATASQIEDARRSLGWTGHVLTGIQKQTWIAPEEWRSREDPKNEDLFDLYVDLLLVNDADNREPATLVARFCGYAGAGIRFALRTNLLDTRPWKTLLRSERAIIGELTDKGFGCDPQAGLLTLPIPLKREALAQAFDTDQFDEALAPFRRSLEAIDQARPVLDRLVAAIRAAAPGCRA